MQECPVLANMDIDITFTVGEPANPAMSLVNVVREKVNTNRMEYNFGSVLFRFV